MQYMTRMPEHIVWEGMKGRCYYQKHIQYRDYGGRGIGICDEWRGRYGFANFYKDMGPRPSNRHTIDRLDNDSDYTPENCVWATRLEQARNKGKYKNNSSGFPGVYWNPRNNRWQAQIAINSKNISLGAYASIGDAIGARLSGECIYWD